MSIVGILNIQKLFRLAGFILRISAVSAEDKKNILDIMAQRPTANTYRQI